MRQEGLLIAAQLQQQQEFLAAQREANLQAAEMAKWNDAVAVIKNKRDDALAKLSSQYNPTISDLISKQFGFQQSLSNLWEKDNIEANQIAHERAKQIFQPTHPWRSLDGKVYNAKDTNWLQFTGKIIEIRPNGILLSGAFGQPLEDGWYKGDYYVDNFPNRKYAMADNEEISTAYNCVAHLDIESSTYVYTNTTIDLRVHTVRRLDYGKIVDSPPQELVNKWTYPISYSSLNGNSTLTKQIIETEKQKSDVDAKLVLLQSEYADKCASVNAECDAEIKDLPNVFAKQYRQQKEQEKQAREAKILGFNQTEADKGDPYGLMRMGERYRDGDGVPKDLFKARDYLTKAAAAGSPTAADELSKLDQNLAETSQTITNATH